MYEKLKENIWETDLATRSLSSKNRGVKYL